MMKETGVATHIAVDAMGADMGPAEVVAGVKLALRASPRPDCIYLVGKEDELEPHLQEEGLGGDKRVQVHHASEVIGMDEKPIQSLKRKKDSSLVRTIELVKERTCQAAVSCGNTGALMACGTLRLRPLEGVERPALGSIWPRRKGHFVMLDVGANPAPRPEHYVHNAILGSHYYRSVFECERPRVGLLSIGTEESKGHEQIQAANERLKMAGDLINYAGPIEGFQVFEDVVDVVVCDGFTGNVLLKTSEALYKMLKNVVKDEIRGPVALGGALMMKGTFNRLKDRLNPERYGGAPLLGLRGNVLKAHGSSNRDAIAAAIRIACEFLAHDLNSHARDDIQRANELLKPLKTSKSEE